MKFTVEGEKTPITTVRICGKIVADFYEGWSVKSLDCGDATCGKEATELVITLKKVPRKSDFDFCEKGYEATLQEEDEFIDAIYKIFGLSSDS